MPEIPIADYVMIIDLAKDDPLLDVLSEYSSAIKFSDVSGDIEGFLALRFHPINSNDSSDSDVPKDSANVQKPLFRCMFIDPDTKLCRIHNRKPMICRIYPLWVGKDSKIWNNTRCLKPWKSSDPVVIQQIESSYDTFIKELEQHRVEVKRWNEQYQGKNIDDLKKFIVDQC